MDRIESTVVCETLPQFLDDATRVGYCFRCGVPVDPSADEWANVAQVMRGPSAPVVVGGMLCEPCVESWREWVEDGYAVEPIVPDGALDHRGVP